MRLQLNKNNRGMYLEKKPCWDLLLGGLESGGVLTRSRIAGVILVFSVGSVAVIASVARLVALCVFRRSKDPSCEFEPCRRPIPAADRTAR